jgi:hypothetical protein
VARQARFKTLVGHLRQLLDASIARLGVIGRVPVIPDNRQVVVNDSSSLAFEKICGAQLELAYRHFEISRLRQRVDEQSQFQRRAGWLPRPTATVAGAAADGVT